MLRRPIAIGMALLIGAGNALAGPPLTVDELCARTQAAFRAQSEAFASLEKAKVRTGRYPPVDKPPVYHWACRGAPHYEQRDKQQDDDMIRYVEKVFLATEWRSATEFLEAARGVQVACDNQQATQSAMDRIGRYFRARIEAAVRDAMAMPGTEKYQWFWPLVRAVLAFEARQQALGAPSFAQGEGNLAVAPLVKAHFYEQERLLREQHELRLTPQIMMRLMKGVESVTDQPEDPLDLVKRLWRFEVDASNTFIFREGEDEQGNVVIESALRNHVMTLRAFASKKSNAASEVVHFEPNEVRFRNQRVEYEGAQFVGPASFPSIIDLGFDPCGEAPAAYLAITEFASEADTLHFPGSDPPTEEVDSPAYFLAPEAMEAKREPTQWKGLPGLVFRLRLQDQNVEVANQTISGSQRREDGAMIADELKIVIRHAPLRAPAR